MTLLPLVNPVTLGFITTDKCTAKCQDCCFGCNQSNNKEVDDSVISLMIRQIKQLNITELNFVLTGGECFLLGDRLYSIIKYISDNGFKTRIVSNGYWATSFKIAYDKLLRLKNVGLDEINVSTGDEHLKWVNYENIVNVIVACVKLSLPIVVNVETSPKKKFLSKCLKNDVRIRKYVNSVTILDGQWISSNKDDEDSVNTRPFNESKGRCTSIFRHPSIDFEGNISPCCGLTSRNHKNLFCDNVIKTGFREIQETWFDDFLKIWIFTEGPYAIMEFYKKSSTNLNIRIPLNRHICEYCSDIYCNDEIIKVLKNNFKKVMPLVIVKYLLLAKRYTQE